jgi:hypothetical protein
MDERIDELKTELSVKDLAWELTLERMIEDWRKWSLKSIHTKGRKLNMDIIKELKRELSDVRATNDFRSTRAVGFKLGRNKAKDGNARNTDNITPSPKRQDMGVAPKRVFSLGRKDKPGKE